MRGSRRGSSTPPTYPAHLTYQTRWKAAWQRRDPARGERRLRADEVPGAQTVPRRAASEEREQKATVECVAGAGRLDRFHAHCRGADVHRGRDPATAAASELDHGVSCRPPPEVSRSKLTGRTCVERGLDLVDEDEVGSMQQPHEP